MLTTREHQHLLSVRGKFGFNWKLGHFKTISTFHTKSNLGTWSRKRHAPHSCSFPVFAETQSQCLQCRHVTLGRSLQSAKPHRLVSRKLTVCPSCAHDTALLRNQTHHFNDVVRDVRNCHTNKLPQCTAASALENDFTTSTTSFSIWDRSPLRSPPLPEGSSEVMLFWKIHWTMSMNPSTASRISSGSVERRSGASDSTNSWLRHLTRGSRTHRHP